MSACHLVPPITVVTSANGSWFIERTCWWGIVINCLMINSRQQQGKNWKFQQHHEKCKGWQTCNCYCIAMIWLFDSRIPYLLFSKSYRYFCSLYSLNILIHWVIWLLDTSPYGACDVYRLLGKLFICTCISACKMLITFLIWVSKNLAVNIWSSALCIIVDDHEAKFVQR